MNETADVRSFSVIATRLPYIDRRSLSEAWFSALHLAADGPVAQPASRRAAVAAPLAAPKRSLVQSAPAPNRFAHEHSPREAARASRTAFEPVRATEAAVRKRRVAVLERARSYAPFRTSLTLGVEGERVALLLRREGATLHVVAVCRPAVADVVRRALACADVHLRARGEAVSARVETLAAGAVA